jgi:NAD(P)-dependent dehydrogenase (short-subunit alcohol dehydrogenase family)
MEFHNSRALVTGSTAGIGREIAKLLAAQGASVIVSGRNAERGAETVAAIKAAGGDASFIAADLSDLASVHKLAEDAGEIDILVNNAGIFPFAATVEEEVSTFDTAFTVNVRGPFFLTAALMPKMIAKGTGSVINISTTAAALGVPMLATYSATKAALESLTRTWAAEFGGHGIRFNTVAPGQVRTDAIVAKLGENIELPGKLSLLGRIAEPKEIAEMVAFLASPRSSYLTGTTIAVDAGLSIART